MKAYRDLLADLPDPADITADARRLYPSRELLQETYSRIQLAGHYLRARYALAALMERIEKESSLRTDPDDPDPRPDEGDPVARITALSIMDDDEECDIGRMPEPTEDATSR